MAKYLHILRTIAFLLAIFAFLPAAQAAKRAATRPAVINQSCKIFNDNKQFFGPGVIEIGGLKFRTLEGTSSEKLDDGSYKVSITVSIKSSDGKLLVDQETFQSTMKGMATQVSDRRTYKACGHDISITFVAAITTSDTSYRPDTWFVAIEDF